MREFEIIEDNEYQNGKITIWNDGKEKHNSWEARLLIETEISGGAVSLILEAYEDTRENAINELNNAFTKLMYQFQVDFGLR